MSKCHFGAFVTRVGLHDFLTLLFLTIFGFRDPPQPLLVSDQPIRLFAVYLHFHGRLFLAFDAYKLDF